MTLFKHFFRSALRWLVPFGTTRTVAAFLLACLLVPSSALAGATPGQWVVVVNGASISSRTVANHFCQIRNVPSNNVIVLQEVPDKDRISLEDFKTLILGPLLEEVQKRGLANHIQGVAYSVDFPTAIDVSSDAKKIPNISKYLTPVGSLNGLTFFYRYVMTDNPAYLSFDANWFARRSLQETLQPLFEAENRKELFVQLDQAKDWPGMAKILSEDAESLPKELRTPNWLLAAILFAKSLNRDETLSHLERSILSGWNYRKVIESQSDFKFLESDKDFLRLLTLCEDGSSEFTDIRSFNARHLYSPHTSTTKDAKYGVPFLLSVVLGVSRDLGLRREEVINGLRRSAQADYTPPKGPIVFTQTTDVRTTTRQPYFTKAVDLLAQRNLEGTVHRGVLPAKGTRCAGLMMGSADFSLGRELIEFEAGAIAENLTSLGGAMTNPSQTKATEFLRYGAAISSGAVHEPYAIINKFPHPFIFDAYAAGLTSAEAYYASVSCPYQLLILGDPLCQPYTKPPRFTLAGMPAVHDRRNPLRFQLQLATDNEVEPAVCWITIDGRFLAEGAFRPTIALNLQTLPIGFHEIRVGLKSDSNMEESFEVSASFQIVDSVFAAARPTWSCPDEFSSFEKTELPIELEGPFLKTDLQVWNRSELIATIRPDAESIPFSLLKWGLGPVALELKQVDEKGIAISYSTRVVEILP